MIIPIFKSKEKKMKLKKKMRLRNILKKCYRKHEPDNLNFEPAFYVVTL